MSRPDMRLFESAHLPPNLRHTAEPFETLARDLDEQLPDASHECRTEADVALRKLLEAKDAAVRSMVLAAKNAGTEGL